MSIQQIISKQNTTLFKFLEESEVIDMALQLDELRATVAQLGKLIDDQKFQLGNLTVTVNTFETTINGLKESVDQSNDNVSTLNNKVNTFETTINGLKESVNQSNNNISVLTNRVNDLEQSVKNLDLDKFESRILFLEDRVKSYDASFGPLLYRVSDLETKTTNLLDRYNFHEEKTNISIQNIRLLCDRYIWFYNSYDKDTNNLFQTTLDQTNYPYSFITTKATPVGSNDVRATVLNIVTKIST